MADQSQQKDKSKPENLEQPVSSSQKGTEEARAENKAPREGTAVAVELDHGEPDQRIEAEREAQREALKDPWGTTPLQSRDSHDPAVDPQTDDAAPPGGPKPSGISPEVTNSQAPEEGQVQGTLPPV